MSIMLWIGIILFGLCVATVGALVWIAPRLEDDLREMEERDEPTPPNVPWRGRRGLDGERYRAPRRLR